MVAVVIVTGHPADVAQLVAHRSCKAVVRGSSPLVGSGFDRRCAGCKIEPMIVITAKFQIKPEYVEAWPQLSADFTRATRNEPGCLWFEWSRSLDDPSVYVLIEAFRDDDAGAAHVQSEHFATARRELPSHLVATPRIINTTAPGVEWSELGEFAV